MSYSDFSLKRIKQEFNLNFIENKDFFQETEEADISEYLRMTLDYNVPLALAINTEKARSELIIANILLELKRQLNDQISLFPGVNLDVDKSRGLSGFCDYILSKSSEQFYLSAPVLAIVEAKNDQVTNGLGQCIAEMIAARIFNDREGNSIGSIYGAVTTGSAWKFLKYENENDVVYIDRPEYYIADVRKIMGILVKMMRQEA
ncbi:MAG: hypothetical protein P9F19_06365 [Candidatus Contendobacter sp.]|nr:hypothetical protein [Candidatus Contendobacter sp.]MDG4556994.1 hypothetical protein [Candidatus Contendobacter sp.]